MENKEKRMEIEGTRGAFAARGEVSWNSMPPVLKVLVYQHKPWTPARVLQLILPLLPPACLEITNESGI